MVKPRGIFVMRDVVALFHSVSQCGDLALASCEKTSKEITRMSKRMISREKISTFSVPCEMDRIYFSRSNCGENPLRTY